MALLAGQKLHAEDINLVPVEAERTADVSTSSTSFVFGSTALPATFTAPPSGRVKVQGYSTQSNTDSASSTILSWQIREGTTQSGNVAYDPLDAVDYRTAGTTLIQAGAGRMHLVSGLEPGVTYTVWARIKVTGGTGTWFRTTLFVEPTL